MEPLGIKIALYIAVMIIVAGIRGGVREEMDGLADIFAIVLWPVWLACLFVWVCYEVLFSLGRALGGRREK